VNPAARKKKPFHTPCRRSRRKGRKKCADVFQFGTGRRPKDEYSFVELILPIIFISIYENCLFCFKFYAISRISLSPHYERRTIGRMTMATDTREHVPQVSGPDRMLTIADLPPPNTTRWVARRKAEVVAAVHGGLLSLHDACERYTLTVEEFLAWQNAIDRHGLAGLRATRVQEYRHTRDKKNVLSGFAIPPGGKASQTNHHAVL
jgi:hypothetical protein